MTLIEQLEAATGPSRELFEAAWLHIHHGGYLPEGPHDTCSKCDAFAALLAIGTDEAFTGAALMLVPEGWHIELERWTDGRGRCEVNRVGTTNAAWAATPALAIAAACVRAHDNEEG